MPPTAEDESAVLISQYPKEDIRVRRGVVIAIGIHVFLAALVCLVTYLMGITSLKELLDKGGSIATSGPAPEEPMTVELLLDEVPPPPVQNPEFIQEIVKPKVQPVVPPKKLDLKPVDKPKPRYTAPNAKGTGRTNTVSKFVVGSSGLPHPPYPVAALDAHQEGTVRLHILFDGSGNVSDVNVTSSSGVILLDVSARNFIKGNWHNITFANQTVDVPIVYSMADPRSSR
jgi:periplasmic protein TonB